PDFAELPTIFPFADEQIDRVAKTEPTLRDMLQQFRHLFDHLVYGGGEDRSPRLTENSATHPPVASRVPAPDMPPEVKSVIVVETLATQTNAAAATSPPHLAELWVQEFRAARRNLEPDGALTGATRELQSGLGAFLQICHEHGVKVGPWRLQHVAPEW